MEKEKILEYIKEEVERTGFYPSYSEISNRFNISKSTVFHRMSALEEDGVIVFNHNRKAYRFK